MNKTFASLPPMNNWGDLNATNQSNAANLSSAKSPNINATPKPFTPAFPVFSKDDFVASAGVSLNPPPENTQVEFGKSIRDSLPQPLLQHISSKGKETSNETTLIPENSHTSELQLAGESKHVDNAFYTPIATDPGPSQMSEQLSDIGARSHLPTADVEDQDDGASIMETDSPVSTPAVEPNTQERINEDLLLDNEVPTLESVAPILPTYPTETEPVEPGVEEDQRDMIFSEPSRETSFDAESDRQIKNLIRSQTD